jgi:hypothetical protein
MLCLSEGTEYNMSVDIEFNEAAFRHDLSKENIRCALNRPEYEGPLDNDENRYIVIGFDPVGNLLEIFYNEIDEHTINVFHAMKCRSIFFHLLD